MMQHEKSLKKLKEVSEDDSLVPVFQDEVHFKAPTTVTRKWAPKGSEPKVMSKPGNNSVSYSGFLIPGTGALYVNKPEWFNYETTIQSFRDFIKQNPLIAGKKYLMILDNAPWHKKAIRLIWKEELEEYQDIRESMTYINLTSVFPGSQPDRTSVEDHTKRENP